MRYASYASFAVPRLRATLSPRDLLKPSMRKDAQNSTNDLRGWSDSKDWPDAQRRAAQAIVFAWVNGWIALAGDSLEAVSN